MSTPVSAWLQLRARPAFIDYLHNYLLLSHHAELVAVQPKWKLGSPAELRDQRNECADPSTYFPDLNQTLGYINELFSRTERLK